MTDTSATVAQSARLRLSRLDAADRVHCQLLVDLYNQHQTPTVKATTTATHGNIHIDSVDMASAYIAKHIDTTLESRGFGTYLVSLRSSHQPVAIVSLARHGQTTTTHEDFGSGSDSDDDMVPVLGVDVLPQHQNQGYATEASRLVIEYSLETLRLDGLLGLAPTDHEKTKQVFVNAGMEYRGDYSLRQLEGQVGSVYALKTMGHVSFYGIEV